MIITINEQEIEITEESSNEEKLNAYQQLVNDPSLLRRILYSLDSIRELLQIYPKPEQVTFILSQVFADEAIISLMRNKVLYDEVEGTKSAYDILNLVPLSDVQKETLFPLIYTNSFFLDDLWRGIVEPTAVFPHHALLLTLIKPLVVKIFIENLDSLAIRFGHDTTTDLDESFNELIQEPLKNLIVEIEDAIKSKKLTLKEAKLVIKIFEVQVLQLTRNNSNAETIILKETDENEKFSLRNWIEANTQVINLIRASIIPQLHETIKSTQSLKHFAVSYIQRNFLLFQPKLGKLTPELRDELHNKPARQANMESFVEANSINTEEQTIIEKFKILDAVSLVDLIDKFFILLENQMQKVESQHNMIFSEHLELNKKIIEHIKNYVAANQNGETNSQELLNQAISSYEGKLTTHIESILPKLQSLLEVVDTYRLQSWFVPTATELAAM